MAGSDLGVLARATSNVADSTEPPPSEVKKASPRGSNVLVAYDDEEPVRKFVELSAQGCGLQDAAMAGDGLEALEVAAKLDRLDILVTDVMMPQMASSELARRLRQSQPTLKSALPHRLCGQPVQGKR